MRLGLTILVVLAVAATPAGAATYACRGPVTDVSIVQNGTVVFSGSGGISAGYICQIGATTNGIGPETCKIIYANLLAARQTNTPVATYFNDNLTCTTQPSWNWLTGVYFGPGPGF
jgi:hypothetical protein